MIKQVVMQDKGIKSPDNLWYRLTGEKINYFKFMRTTFIKKQLYQLDLKNLFDLLNLFFLQYLHYKKF